MIWDVVALFFILFESVALPLVMCFSVIVPAEVNTSSTFFFAFDVVFSFCTGYFHGSLLIMKRRWIAFHYIRTWFVLDVCSTVPWEFLLTMAGQAGSGGNEATLLRIGK